MSVAPWRGAIWSWFVVVGAVVVVRVSSCGVCTFGAGGGGGAAVRACLGVGMLLSEGSWLGPCAGSFRLTPFSASVLSAMLLLMLRLGLVVHGAACWGLDVAEWGVWRARAGVRARGCCVCCVVRVLYVHARVCVGVCGVCVCVCVHVCVLTCLCLLTYHGLG